MAEKKVNPEIAFPRAELGHENVRSFLSACLQQRVPPLLFTGPEGVGKAHAALDFARRLCCPQTTTCELSDPLCESCQAALGLEHPGIHLVFPTPTQGGGEKPGDDEGDLAKIMDEKRQDFFETHRFPKKVSIRVARARAIIQRAYTKPFGSSHNVFIIADAHLMREEAQNALLKLVEEPPDHCVLVFITENPDSILYTIRSRCQRVRFSPLKTEVVASLLVDGYGLSPALAAQAAELSQGSIVRARRIAAEYDDEERRNVYEILTKIKDAPDFQLVHSALSIARGGSRDKVARFLHEFAVAYRDIMAADPALVINRDQRQLLAAQVCKWDRKDLPTVVERIVGTRDGILRRNLNMDAALVTLFLDIKYSGC